MTKKKIGIAAVILAIFLTVFGLACCGNNEKEKNMDSDQVRLDDGKTTEIDISRGLRIVYPSGISDNAFAAVLETEDAVREYKGVPEVIADSEESGPSGAAELYIGNVRRNETVVAAARIKKLEPAARWYYIGTENGKIILLGSDDFALYGAARHLSRLYLQRWEGNAEVPVSAFHELGTGGILAEVMENGHSGFIAVEENVGTAPWLADLEGKEDSSRVIQSALNCAGERGGGIVFLPKGNYKLEKPLYVPECVMLRGYCADSETPGNGTVLSVSFGKRARTNSAVVLSVNSAAEGITFLYPDRALDEEYGFTVLGTGNCMTVRDCVFLNSWNGISSGPDPVGMICVENVRGTVIHTGIEFLQHADVSTVIGVDFSPSYFATYSKKTGSGISEEKIRAEMRKAGSAGMVLCDVDRDTFENVTLDGFDTGIKNEKGERAGLSASFFNLRILNSRVGISAENLHIAYGVCIAGGDICSSEYSVKNLSPPQEGNLNRVNLLNVRLTGLTYGTVESSERGKLSRSKDKSPVTMPVKALFSLAAYGADSTGKNDASGALQNALNDAETAGGGIVYIPAGIYKLEKPVTVARKIHVQGAYPAVKCSSDGFRGTVILACFGKGSGEKGQAQITVSGDRSGVTGLTVYYPGNGIRNSDTGAPPSAYSPFVRCTGRNTFFMCSCLIAASAAASFDGADGFTADRLTGTFYDCGVHANGCTGGKISRIHTNGTYHISEKKDRTVLGSDWFTDYGKLFEVLIDGILAKRLVQVRATGCRGLEISHTFYYGGLHLADLENSDATLICVEGARSTTETFLLRGGVAANVIIANRPNGLPAVKKEGTDNFLFLNHMNNSVGVFTGEG